MVVPYAPGRADVLSRLSCQRLPEKLGHPLIVENKPGSGSMSAPRLSSSRHPTPMRCCSPRDIIELLNKEIQAAILDQTIRHRGAALDAIRSPEMQPKEMSLNPELYATSAIVVSVPSRPRLS